MSVIRPGAPPRSGVVAAVAIGAVVVTVGAVLAVTAPVSDAEREVFAAFNNLPRAVGLVLLVAMPLGSFAAIPLVAGVAWLLRRWRMATRQLAVDALIAGLAAWAGAQALKALVGRGRPAEELVTAVIRGTPVDGAGYPSGHSAVSAALAAAVVWRAPPRWRPAIWAVPILVGFARMYIGAHLPLDVLGGWALGAGIGFAVAWAPGSRNGSGDTTGSGASGR